VPRPIGPTITKYRKAADDMTKAELARRSGVSAPYLTQIEANDRTPSKEVLIRIAGALGIENFKLLEPAGYRFDNGTYFDAIDRNIAWLRDRLTGDESTYFELILEDLPELGQWVTSGPAMPIGPDGWAELNAEDQRIVQQLIHRLRDGQTES